MKCDIARVDEIRRAQAARQAGITEPRPVLLLGRRLNHRSAGELKIGSFKRLAAEVLDWACSG